MNELKIFENRDFGKIRSLMVNNEPFFVGNDIATVLGYKNTRDALSKHIDEEDKISDVKIYDGNKNRNMTIIKKSKKYSLILSSKLESAKKFKRWVTSEVLPSIKKNGMYATDELLNNPDLAIKVFEQLKQEREEKKKLQLENAKQKKALEDQKPKILFADSVETSTTSILIGDLAKLLRQNGYDIGQNRLFDWLRNNDYLIKNGERKNMPTQKAMDLELFEIKERTLSNPDGSVRVTRTTKVTGKGQVYFVNKFLKKVI